MQVRQTDTPKEGAEDTLKEGGREGQRTGQKQRREFRENQKRGAREAGWPSVCTDGPVEPQVPSVASMKRGRWWGGGRLGL